MAYRLLIDECLSPELLALAIEAGHVESTCVRDRGRLGDSDLELMVYVIAHDLTLVTNNAVDFRGDRGGEPGGLHAVQELHAGLICLESHYALDIERQRHLFGHALEALRGVPDLINQAMEVHEEEDGTINISVYEIARI